MCRELATPISVSNFMSLIENMKRVAEHMTGMACPSAQEVKALTRPRKPQTFSFRDDGETPNNLHLPLLHYRSAVRLVTEFDAAAIFEVLFAAHGWKQSWRNGMYDFNHFHTRTHEVLGIARGSVVARFGGKKGRKIRLKAGDVVAIPAGTGHYRLSQSADLLIVGAYPAGGKYDEPKPEEAPANTRTLIARVARPAKDPVYGAKGPMLRLWKKR
jgi:uncharacterized protein YjlB